jgi:hypothetical protein
MINILTKIKESFVKTWKGEEKLTNVILIWCSIPIVIHLIIFLYLYNFIIEERFGIYSIEILMQFTIFIITSYFSLFLLFKNSKCQRNKIILFITTLLMILLLIPAIPMIIGLLFGVAMGLWRL